MKGMEPENRRTATQRNSCSSLFEGSSAALDRSEKLPLQEGCQALHCLSGAEN